MNSEIKGHDSEICVIVFTAYILIYAQRPFDINTDRSPLLFLNMIDLTPFEGAPFSSEKQSPS